MRHAIGVVSRLQCRHLRLVATSESLSKQPLSIVFLEVRSSRAAAMDRADVLRRRVDASMMRNALRLRRARAADTPRARARKKARALLRSDPRRAWPERSLARARAQPRRQIEQQRAVRLQITVHGARELLDPLRTHAAPAALIGARGVGEAVADHPVAARQRRTDEIVRGGCRAPRTSAAFRVTGVMRLATAIQHDLRAPAPRAACRLARASPRTAMPRASSHSRTMRATVDLARPFDAFECDETPCVTIPLTGLCSCAGARDSAARPRCAPRVSSRSNVHRCRRRWRRRTARRCPAGCTAASTDSRPGSAIGVGGKPGARVSVVRRVGREIARADVAVVLLADAVDHGGIGLQPHALAQARGEHAGDHRPLGGEPGLLLDRSRPGSAPRTASRSGRSPDRAAPRPVEHLLHVRVGELQQFHVGGARGEAISVREEPPFRMLARVADGDHHFGVALAAQGRRSRRDALRARGAVPRTSSLRRP